MRRQRCLYAIFYKSFIDQRFWSLISSRWPQVCVRNFCFTCNISKNRWYLYKGGGGVLWFSFVYRGPNTGKVDLGVAHAPHYPTRFIQQMLGSSWVRPGGGDILMGVCMLRNGTGNQPPDTIVNNRGQPIQIYSHKLPAPIQSHS